MPGMVIVVGRKRKRPSILPYTGSPAQHLVLGETNEALISVQEQRPGLTLRYPDKKPTRKPLSKSLRKLLYFMQEIRLLETRE